jgi:hypothetical protein
MIDIEANTELLLFVDRQAMNVANLSDDRIERELQAIHDRAFAALVAGGEDDLEAFIAADAIVERARQLVANHRRRRAANEAQETARRATLLARLGL